MAQELLQVATECVRLTFINQFNCHNHIEKYFLFPSLLYLASIRHSVKDNMKRIYLVHPTYWLRFCFWWATSFVSESFWPKLVYVESLYGEMDGIDFAVEQLKLPDFVFEYDAYYHGAPLKTATAATAAGASSHRE